MEFIIIYLEVALISNISAFKGFPHFKEYNCFWLFLLFSFLGQTRDGRWGLWAVAPQFSCVPLLICYYYSGTSPHVEFFNEKVLKMICCCVWLWFFAALSKLIQPKQINSKRCFSPIHTTQVHTYSQHYPQVNKPRSL